MVTIIDQKFNGMYEPGDGEEYYNDNDDSWDDETYDVDINSAEDQDERHGVCSAADKDKRGGYMGADRTIYCASSDYIPYQQQHDGVCGVIHRDLDRALPAISACNTQGGEIQIFACMAVHRAYNSSEEYLACLLKHGARMTNLSQGEEGDIDATFCYPAPSGFRPGNNVIGDNYQILLSMTVILGSMVAGLAGFLLMFRAISRPFEDSVRSRTREERQAQPTET